ncbi:pyruvate kinase [Patescibacteria group bacterium]
MSTKNTKVVCTLGPSSDSVSELVRLIQSGMNVARLNFSHGSHKHHKEIINNLHAAEKKTGKIVALMQDLQGPKIRTGKLPFEGIEIRRGEKITLTVRKVDGSKKKKKTIIPIQYKGLAKDVKGKDTILIDDGLMEVEVQKVKGPDIFCKVKYGGVIFSHKGIAAPSAVISAQTITPKDRKDLEFGLKNDVDYVALSFVKDANDIKNLRKLIEKKHKKTKIIAKVERHEAIGDNLEPIIKETDAVMVARGDLGINIPAEKVPIVQKKMIKLANRYAKPVITATQVLDSMIHNPVATRAEISDAANSIFDHTDAIMLSNETAVGKYPAKAAKTLTNVAETVEKELQLHEELIQTKIPDRDNLTSNAMCLNACELATDLDADKIVVYTDSGFTARQIAKHRPYKKIITITPNIKVARELALIWGLNKIVVGKLSSKNSENILKFLKKEKLVKKGETIVIVCNADKRAKLISTLKV